MLDVCVKRLKEVFGTLDTVKRADESCALIDDLAEVFSQVINHTDFELLAAADPDEAGDLLATAAVTELINIFEGETGPERAAAFMNTIFGGEDGKYAVIEDRPDYTNFVKPEELNHGS